ncbi:MAG: DNA polymerase-3 subunit delta [Chloroflexi bacterium]|nr:MAG: DNA polymerase-3 subunit delta [Chloroflexota bacterium]
MPIFHYYGADAFSRREAYDALRARHDADAALSANTLVLDGPRTTLAELTAAAMTVPFLAAYRLVRVDGICASYNMGRNPTAARRRRKPDAWADLPQRLETLPDSTLLVFIDAELDTANPMKRLLADIAEVTLFTPLRRRDLSPWLHRRAQNAGLHLTPRAESALVDRVGGDMAALASEIDKLQIYAGDATVDEHVIQRLCPRNDDAEIWDLTAAVGQGRPGPALRALETLWANGAQTPRLLGALARQMRQIVIAQEILAEGGNADTVRERLRIRHPFPAKKLTEQAQRFPSARAAAALPRIRDCDAAIQRFRRDLPGGLRDNLALELLVVDLATAQPKRT